MAFELKQHQKEAVTKTIKVLTSKNLAYIFGQPRVGKSLISLETIKQLQDKMVNKGKTIVFTKKAAIVDWLKYKEQYTFEVENYEKISKCRPGDYNFIIIDEAHNFGAFPKPSQRIKLFRQFCKNKPIIFLSGTPLVENINSIYSQLSLSTWSPFNTFKNAYSFFREYGIPSPVWLYGKQMESYKKGNILKIMQQVEPLVIRVTYEDAGFVYQNFDEVVMLNSPEMTRLMRGLLSSWTAASSYVIRKEESLTKSISNFMSPAPDSKQYFLENISAQCQAMHKFCGGFYKDLNLPQVKLDWLKEFIEKHKNTKIAVMCYFIDEQEKLSEVFKSNKNIAVLSSTKYCEGIDLSHYDHFVLYSFGYSGSKFIQLRDRIVNLDKQRETKVIIPLIKDGLDYSIYRSVSNKKTFNTTMCRKLYDKSGLF